MNFGAAMPRPQEVYNTMVRAVTGANDVHYGRGGVALAEPPSSAPTARIPALHDQAVNAGPHSQRYLSGVLADAGPLMEIGAALELSVVDRIAVGNGPIAGLVASGDGRRLVVTNHGDDSVSMLNTRSGAVERTVTGLGEPFAIETGGFGHAHVSTASTAYDALAVIDLNTDDVVALHPLAHAVRDVAVSPDGTRVYASRNKTDGTDVAVLETATGRVETIDLATPSGVSADCVAISPDGRRLYVATQRPTGGGLAVIDTAARRVVDTIDIGSPIRDIALNRDGGIAYVAASGPDFGGVVDIVDTGAAVVTGSTEIEASGAITQLTLSKDGDRAYLVADGGLTVMSTLTHDVVDTVTPEAQPSCVAEGVDGSRLYIADYTGAVTVVSVALMTASLVGEFADRPELASV